MLKRIALPLLLLVSLGSFGIVRAGEKVFSAVSFDKAINDQFYETMPDLAKVMVRNTDIDYRVEKDISVVYVAAVVQDGEVLDYAVSEEVQLISGEPVAVLGKKPLNTVWEAFEHPTFAFVSPTFGQKGDLEGIWGTGGVALTAGKNAPAFLWGTDGNLVPSPEEAIDAVWGSDGASFRPEQRVLMLFSLPVTETDEGMFHQVALLSFVAK